MLSPHDSRPVTRPSDTQTTRIATLTLALALAGIAPAYAQVQADHADLVAQIAALRAQQAQIAEMQRQTDASIRALEARLGLPVSPVAAPASPVDVATQTPAPATSVPAPRVAGSASEARLKVSGDLRLRAQGDYSDQDGTNRNSTQLRARVGATFALNDRITLGGRLVTGDSDDPNSTDVQLSNWDDDLQVSLDLAYAQFNFGNLKVYGGKMPQPFVRTDLVWDGDVNPQGFAATYKLPLSAGGAFRANALFFTIDEQVAGPDSSMGGVQFGYDSPGIGGFKYDVSAGYYDYHLPSVAGADAGDWRSNRLGPDGRFLSAFRLFDVIGGATWQGANEKWPVRVVGNYVRNLGAIDAQDTGFAVDLSAGRASKAGDWRVTYGYSQTDVDAVLSAFSHDNIGIATNYKLHALTLDYTPMPKTQISAIWYHYKPNDPLYAGSNDANDWLNRVRVFFLMNF